MPEIALEQVSKIYPGNIRAVSDLSLSIHDGEFLVLVGPSGCGKTTTLRLLAGLEKPTQGAIRFGGKMANSWPPRRRDVAMVFQRSALYPGRSVRENLAVTQTLRQGGWIRQILMSLFSPDDHRRQIADIEQRIQQAALVLDLEPVLDRPSEQLSGGQQQRVALGRALVRRARLILLDEPLGNLDAGLRLELRRQLHLLHRQFPATMVYVTHDPVEALSLGDRLAVLQHGRLQQIDAPRTLLERPANRFVAEFIGWPPMNFLQGQLCRAGEGLAFQPKVSKDHLGECCQVALRGLKQASGDLNRPAVLGVRPQQVTWHLEAVPGSFPMQVVQTEFFGSQTLVSLSGFGQKLAGLADCESKLPFVEGQKVMVSIDASPAYLFDPQSGLALPTGPATG